MKTSTSLNDSVQLIELHIQPVFDEPEGFLLEIVRTPVQPDRGGQ